MPDAGTEISVIIVTYNSARYLGDCLAALRAQGVGLRVIIVDNASRPKERPVFCPQDAVEVILNNRNRGFAPAVNQALGRVRTPYMLLLNPDVRLMPEALARMRTFLERTPSAAAVSPRFWWDTERVALLPLTTEPTLARLILRAAATHSRVLYALFDRWRIRQARQWWFAQQEVEVRAISCGCALMTAQALDRVGPLDAQFPFYYEEVEWSLRARRYGYRLFALPSVEAVHAFGHSYRSGSRRVQRWAAVSGRRYWSARYGRYGARLATALSTQPVDKIFIPAADLGVLIEPPLLEWPRDVGSQVLEIAFDPLFESSVAIFPVGDRFEWPITLWNEMPAGAYHARLLDGASLRPAVHWRWQRLTDPPEA